MAPTIGMKAPRKTSTPIARTNGTPSRAATIMMPIASVAATITVARTNWVSEIQATRPEVSTCSRAARGTIRTSQAQIRSPSARKKYVANRMMKNPASTWPNTVPTSVTRPRTSEVSLFAVIDFWVSLDVVVDLRVAGVAAARSRSQSLISLEALDHLVGEVVGAVRDLLADEGEQGDDHDQAADHDETGTEPAPDPDAVQPAHDGVDRAAISSATTSGSTTTAKKRSATAAARCPRR